VGGQVDFEDDLVSQRMLRQPLGECGTIFRQPGFLLAPIVF